MPPPPAPKSVYKGSQWKGMSNIKNLFIFGDSYSSLTDSPTFLPRPTVDSPLGIPWPGHPWTEEGEPNWVGHLHTFLTKPRSLTSKSKPSPSHPVMVYDYARGGDTVYGLAQQTRGRFMKQLQKGELKWTAEDSLFIIWIGVNDLSETSSPVQPMKLLFQLMNELYGTGARNFLLIDCPPIHRTPSADPEMGPDSERFEDWNKLLTMQARFFVSRHQDYTNVTPTSPVSPTTPSGNSNNPTHAYSFSSASSNSSSSSQTHSSNSGSSLGGTNQPTTSPLPTPNGTTNHVQGETTLFVFSSYTTLESILDYPEAYGFTADDVDQAAGQIWMDDLHPSGKVHAILGGHLGEFLLSV